MNHVLVSTQFDSADGGESFARTVEALLKGMGMNVKTDCHCGTLTVIAYDAYNSVENSGISAGVEPDIEPTVELPVVTDDAPVDPVSPPVNMLPLTPESQSMVIRNLDINAAIPVIIDPTSPCTLLRVPEVSQHGDGIAFTYCGLAIKSPIETPLTQNLICNKNPSFTDTSIRSMATLVNSDLPDLPILFKLVTCAEGEKECVVLGQDVLHVLNSMEKAEDDTLPA